MTNERVVVVTSRYQRICAVDFGVSEIAKSNVQHARQAGKCSVAFGGWGEDSLRGLLCIVVVDDGRVGLLARFDLSEIRGLVLLLFWAVIISLAYAAQKNRRVAQIFGAQDHDVVTTRE